jgi:hypothetical protein
MSKGKKNIKMKALPILALILVFFILASPRADALVKIVSTYIDMLGNSIYNVGYLNATGWINGTSFNGTYYGSGENLQNVNTYNSTYDALIGGSSVSPEATYTMFSTGIAMANNSPIMDLFNGAGSGKVIRVLEVFAYQKDTGAITGIVAPIELFRTNATGTGGAAISYGIFDTTDESLPAQITARTGPTGGVLTGVNTTGNVIAGGRVGTEEGSLGTGAAISFPWFQSQSAIYVNTGESTRKRLVLREGEGLKCQWGVVSGTAAGLAACGVTFQTGNVYTNELPTFSWMSNTTATANKNMTDIFNAAGSGKILKITRISAYSRTSGAAITGIIISIQAMRTTTVGTGGTVITADRYDTTDLAMPGQITAREAPTGGIAPSGGILIADTLGTDETSFGEYRGNFRTTEGMGYNTQYTWDSQTTRRPITLREGEGMVIRVGALSGVGNIVIIVEGTLE